MYSALSSINWMFIEGLLLHSRITTSIFKKSFPFKLYYVIGWGLPLIIIIVWSCLMSQQLHTPCWEGYGKLNIIWLITAPMIFVLMINFVFLINIIRILMTRLKLTSSEETTRIRKAFKATILLFPLLGTTHLLFCLNPKNSELEEAYMITNAFLQSSQGIFVSFFYCFLNNDVQNAIRNAYLRAYTARSGGKRSTTIFCKRRSSKMTSVNLDGKCDSTRTDLKLTMKNNKTQCTLVKPKIEEGVV
ncbi:corticotropin-releasing factor receptor 2-like protein [Leptotrombidium deliense]|uniref:Corticotropin-releasing factor receptor 2-like protein n=1 Tax=Leptotrombidium deliense TaxID=299467 RepID=A0A443SDE9_9ACAR|nr:corticotropin-releasing factor receptor 2-like protein [Leptotrombidium deliense]